MKCPKCKQELTAWPLDDRCGRCEPVDTDTSTCGCGGIQDYFYYIDYETEHGYPEEIHEYRCRVCQESEYESEGQR